MPESIAANSAFTSSTMVLNILQSGIDDIIQESGVTISSTTSYPVVSTSYTNQSVIYNKNVCIYVYL